MRKVIVVALVVLFAGLARAAVDPLVTEELIEDPPDNDRLRYTVINDADSSVGHIVGFAVELADWASGAGLPSNSWTGNILSSWDWTDPVDDDHVDPLTWQKVFGGIEWPFAGADYAASYVLYYDEEGGGMYSFSDPTAAISPGESESGFTAWLGMPSSRVVLAHTGDPAGSFAPDEFQIFEGATVPEPATLGLLLIGGLALLKRKRST